MIDYNEPREKFEQYLDSISEITVPIVLENTAVKDIVGEHIEIMSFDNDAQIMEAGGSIYLITGSFLISIFTHQGSGTSKARDIASAIVNSISIPDVIPQMSFTEPEFTSVGPKEDSNLYENDLIIKYFYFYGQNDAS